MKLYNAVTEILIRATKLALKLKLPSVAKFIHLTSVNMLTKRRAKKPGRISFRLITVRYKMRNGANGSFFFYKLIDRIQPIPRFTLEENKRPRKGHLRRRKKK